MSQAPEQERMAETTYQRIDRKVGFNARVEPVWHAFKRLQGKMGFFEKLREKGRVKRIVARINERLERFGVKPDDWDRADGECVCNLRVAKMGLVTELNTYMGKQLESEKLSKWKHVQGQKDVNAVSLPLDFPEPFSVDPGRGDKPVGVTSSKRLQIELEEINGILRIEETFALAKMSRINFVDATERDISVYESKFAALNDFWPKFTYILLKKLADKSVESGFPIQFA